MTLAAILRVIANAFTPKRARPPLAPFRSWTSDTTHQPARPTTYARARKRLHHSNQQSGGINVALVVVVAAIGALQWFTVSELNEYRADAHTIAFFSFAMGFVCCLALVLLGRSKR